MLRDDKSIQIHGRPAFGEAQASVHAVLCFFEGIEISCLSADVVSMLQGFATKPCLAI